MRGMGSLCFKRIELLGVTVTAMLIRFKCQSIYLMYIVCLVFKKEMHIQFYDNSSKEEAKRSLRFRID